MANPQPDKFTRFSNELFDAYLKVCRFLSPYENSVWLCIFRKTYGFNKKTDILSLGQLEKFTGIKIRHVSRTKKRLFLKKMIIMNKNGIGIQKNFDLWNLTATPSAGSPQTGSPQTGNPLLPKQGSLLLPKQGDTKDIIKDNIKDIKTQKKFLDFVFLTDEEHKKLVDKFGAPATEKYIERLNNYIGSKGKKYKSHYFTILNWHGKETFTPTEKNKLSEQEQAEQNLKRARGVIK